MTSATHNDTDNETTTGEPGWVGVTGLQCELRHIFSTSSPHRALSSALQRIAQSLSAKYAVVHARFETSTLSEEWCPGGAKIDEAFRESVNESMWEAVSEGTAKFLRFGHDQSFAIIAAMMYDQDVEQSGAAAIVLEDCSRERAIQSLAQFESLIGFLALLVTGSVERRRSAPNWNSAELVARSASAAQHPVQLAFTMAAELKNRHGFDLSAIGFVRGHDVKVAAVCGLDEVKNSNPGVKMIRSAMEECHDRNEVVVHAGPNSSDPDVQDDCRIHAQWSKVLGGNAVASFPLRLLDDIVGVVSVSYNPASDIQRARIVEISESTEMVQYGGMVPLSRMASRNLIEHTIGSVRESVTSLLGAGKRKRLILTTILASFCLWLAFGSLEYTFTVPCSVKAADRRFISCPREGVLSDLFVRPGENVQSGQLLAVLDSHDEELHLLEIEAEIASVKAQADIALAEGNFADLRVLEAKKQTLAAQFAIAVRSIDQAKIRAPQAGIILGQDMREQIGNRLSKNEPMFELARHDRVTMVLEIPENRVLDAPTAQQIEFAANARPDLLLNLQNLELAPASTVVNGRNVFLSDAEPESDLTGLSPGMEGVAQVNVGPRRVWWVFSHRFVDWLRLNFWI